MNFQDGLFPPPSAWKPVCTDVTFEIVEGTIVLYHLVSYDSFNKKYEGGQSITIGGMRNPVVTLNNREYSLGGRFIYDVVYGYESIKSCINGLLLFAHDIESNNISDSPIIPESKPKIWHVETSDEIDILLKQNELSDLDYVSMPKDLAKSLNNAAPITKGHGEGLAIMTVENLKILVNEHLA